MSQNSPTSGKTSVWSSTLSAPVVGTAVGALLAAVYSALVTGVHFASSGRWDRSLEFAGWVVLVGAGVGLALGIAFALITRLGGPTTPQETSSLERLLASERLQGPGLAERHPAGFRL
jgi:hypothetical protein